MANVNPDVESYAHRALPSVRRIAPSQLRDILAKGWDDFEKMPTHAVFLVVIYPIVGVLLFSLTFGYDMLPLFFPLVAGFALLGPVAAVGLYELSRRRERGLDVSQGGFTFLRSPAMGTILTLGIILLAIFVAWLSAAQAIYTSIFGTFRPQSIMGFVQQVLTTKEGWTLIIVGCGFGFLFALATFTISVVSFPLVLDRNVGAATAVLTSIKAVAANPVTMAIWGIIVAVALVLGALPFFVGLIVVLPVLGHATWHLYRAVVE